MKFCKDLVNNLGKNAYIYLHIPGHSESVTNFFLNERLDNYTLL